MRTEKTLHVERMFGWGSNVSGELGLGASTDKVLLPELVTFPNSHKIIQVASGRKHTLFLTTDGQLFSSGNNDFGQLGHNGTTNRPEYIDSLEGNTITQLAVGDQHSIAITSLGLLFSWGDNHFGQLGHPMEENVRSPKLVKSMALKNVIQCTCGSNHTIVLTLDGQLYSWGLNQNGQLGLDHIDSPVKEPQYIKLLTGIPMRLIKAGGCHSLALTEGGHLFTWGMNENGQLGRQLPSNQISCAIPKVVSHLATYSGILCYAAAGKKHTVVLDSDGKVWTFGYGKYGQLGHGNDTDSPIPRSIAELIGTRVSQVACGQNHTITFIPSRGKIQSFGNGQSGQLGMGALQNLNSPQVVDPWETLIVTPLHARDDTEQVYIHTIFAGGNASFALVTSETDQRTDFSQIYNLNQPLCIEPKKVDDMLHLSSDDVIDNDLFTYAELAFRSSSCWNRSFLKDPANKQDHALNYRLARKYMSKLGEISRDTLADLIRNGIEEVTNEVTQPLSHESMRRLIIFPLWKGFQDVTNVSKLHEPLAQSLLRLSPSYLDIFKIWLKSLPLHFMKLVISIYKNVIAHTIEHRRRTNYQLQGHFVRTDHAVIEPSLKVLKIFYFANNEMDDRQRDTLANEDFHITEIATNINLFDDYEFFLRDSTNTSVVSFCEYPFVLDAVAKTGLLSADTQRQMIGAMETRAYVAALFNQLPHNRQRFFEVVVRRSHLVADTIRCIENNRHNLKLPMKVEFLGEEGEDAGGVKKEFFLLLIRDLLNPDYGMFKEYEDTHKIWFREFSLEIAHMYHLIGNLCGLAIYNSTIINLPFPLALYKKLCNKPVYLDDLAELDPTFARGLNQLLEYEGPDFEEVFNLDFTVNRDFYGKQEVVSLKKGGENIVVTAKNREEYVTCYVDWQFNRSISEHYAAFHDGFHKVCGSKILQLFQPLELMSMVTGNENYDWNDFEKNAQYLGGYSSKHPTIQIFWEVFHDLSLERKKKFLHFLTGTDRIPILGMNAVRIYFQPIQGDNHLPVAHTCVGQLDLPTYSTQGKLRYKLIQAIEQTEGFGLV